MTAPRSPAPAAARSALRPLSRLVFLAGAVAIGLFLFHAAPRDVTLVYGLAGTSAEALDVDVVHDGTVLRHSEFHFAAGTPPTASHHVRLPDGDYLVRATIVAHGTARLVERPIHVSESGPIVIPLGS